MRETTARPVAVRAPRVPGAISFSQRPTQGQQPGSSLPELHARCVSFYQIVCLSVAHVAVCFSAPPLLLCTTERATASTVLCDRRGLETSPPPDDRRFSPNSIPTFPPITIFLQYAAIRCDIEQYLCDTYEMRNMIRAQIEKTICTERH